MEEQVRELGEAWAAAELRGDTSFMERTFADDFVAIGPRGFMLTKGEWLARHASGDLKYQSHTFDEVRVHSYGDAAVVTGREAVKGTYQGHEIQGLFRIGQFFVKQDGRWRLAALQHSPIVAGP